MIEHTRIAEGPGGRVTWRSGGTTPPTATPPPVEAPTEPESAPPVEITQPRPEARLPEGMKTIADSRGMVATLKERSRSEEARAAMGVRTGFPAFDNATGGLVRGKAHAMVADSGIGKSNLALTIAYNVAADGYNVLYGNFEMGEDVTVSRLLGITSQLDANAVWTGKLLPGDVHLIDHAWSHLSQLSIIMDYRREQTVQGWIERIRVAHAIRPIDLIVADHLGLLSHNGATDYNAYSTIVTKLNALAVELNCAILYIHQTNAKRQDRIVNARGVEGADGYQQSDVAGARKVYEHMDVLAFLDRNKSTEDPQSTADTVNVAVHVHKGRNGGEGIVNLIMRKSCCRFEPLGSVPQPCCAQMRGIIEDAEIPF